MLKVLHKLEEWLRPGFSGDGAYGVGLAAVGGTEKIGVRYHGLKILLSSGMRETAEKAVGKPGTLKGNALLSKDGFQPLHCQM